jgi:hypothetical protein
MALEMEVESLDDEVAAPPATLEDTMDTMAADLEYAEEIIEQRTVLDALMGDVQARGRHHPVAVEAATAGNLWQANNFLELFVDNMTDVSRWLVTIMAAVVRGEDPPEEFHMFMFLFGSNVQIVRRVLEEYGEAISANIRDDAHGAIEQYQGHHPSRKSEARRLQEDAYADPDVAAMAELTKGGIKTRNRFYKR